MFGRLALLEGARPRPTEYQFRIVTHLAAITNTTAAADREGGTSSIRTIPPALSRRCFAIDMSRKFSPHTAVTHVDENREECE